MLLLRHMCFSATASFMAAAPLSAVGATTIKKAKKKSQIPFAAFPLLFGIQQAIEGVVWLTFSHSLPMLHMAATYAYAIFAYVFWPIFVPFAVRLPETIPWRKKIMTFLQIVGLAVGLYLLYFIVRSPVTSNVVHESIAYRFSQPFTTLSIIFYLVAACLSFFFSSNKIIKSFGFLLVLSLTVTYYFYSTYVVSVWCFFSAILSSVVIFYVVSDRKKGLASKMLDNEAN